MSTGTLDTQLQVAQLKVGSRVNIDGKVGGVFAGELEDRSVLKKLLGPSYVFVYDASSESAGNAIGEIFANKSTTTIEGDRVFLNGAFSIHYYYPKTDGRENKKYFDLLKLIGGVRC